MTKPFPRRSLLLRATLSLLAVLSSTLAFAQPVISSFTPVSGAPGTTVTITGTGFNPTPTNNFVWFGGVRAVVITASATSLTVTSPAGATYDRLSVLDTTTHLLGYSSASFLPTFTGGATNQTVINATRNPAINFTTRLHFPNQLYTADLDGDGKPDIIANDISTPSIWRNTSTPGHLDNTSFAPFVSFGGSGPNTPNLALADLDGDGKLDLIGGASFTTSLAGISKNTSTPGTINFTSVSSLTNSSGPIAAADIDGDGKPDLLIASSSTLSVYFNTTPAGGAISFASPVTYSLGGNSNDIVVTDVDGDHKPDVVTANNRDKTISILRNTATPGTIDAGSLASPVLLTLNHFAVTLALRDMDADSKPDIVFTTDSGAAILKNLTTPGTITTASFASEVDFPTAVSDLPALAIGDLDGDGKPDLVIDNFSEAGGGTGFVSILKNITPTGIINAGSFATRTDVYDNPGSIAVAVVDVDGDGTAELLITNEDPGFSTRLDFVSVIHPVINTQPPTLTAITPDSAATGATVTIKGLNLSGATAVSLGGTPVTSFSTLSDTVITAKVAGGASGNVSVTTSLGTGTLAGFHFISPTPPPPTLLPPAMASFNPTHAKQGDTVTIKGLHLDSVSTLTFGGIAAQAFHATGDTVIRAVVGAGATGNIIAINRVGRDTLPGFVFDTIPVTPPDTTKPPHGHHRLNVYPNPSTTGYIFVTIPDDSSPSQIRIIDLAGRVVLVDPVPAGTDLVKINVAQLRRGVYRIVWSNGNKTAYQHVLIMK
jgi:hypothetical protein